MEKPGSRGINKKLYNQEVDILKGLKADSNTNVVKLMDNFETDHHYYVVTELATGGELFERITNTSRFGKFTEKKASRLIKTMLETLSYIHSKSIVHRDIKPENFVFASHAPNAPMILIDFGCALKVDMKTEYKDRVGTPYYLSPESAAKRSRTGEILCKSDLWAVGVIAYIMMTGQTPFKGRRHADILAEILTKPVRFPKSVKLSSSYKEFVRAVLKKPPARRVTVDEALRFAWIKGEETSDETIHEEVLKCLKQFNYQTLLKKKVSNLLADNMGQEPRLKIKGHFDKLDSSGDGYLDEHELCVLLKSLDKSLDTPQAERQAKQMLQQADSVTEDGKIDFEEFAAIWQRKLLTQNDSYIKAVFKVLDTDGDKKISLSELKGIFKTGSDEEFEAMLQEVDTDGDGFISYEEFKVAMKEKIEQGQMSSRGDILVGGNIEENDLVDKAIEDFDDVDEFDEQE